MLPDQPNFQVPGNPTCGVVVEKNNETQEEKICGAPASQLVTMVDPKTKSKVIAILLVCERHDQSLEDGKELIFLSDDGRDHILVTYDKERILQNKEDNKNDA